MGNQRYQPNQAFVIIERKAVSCASSALKAVDMCFKAHYVLNLEYQNQCRAIWQFLETLVFEIHKSKSKQELVTSVREFGAFYNVVTKYKN